MRFLLPRLVALALLSGALLAPLAARAAPQPQQPARLQVATRLVEPFVIERPSGLSGFSVELWAEIAARAGWSYEWTIVPGTITDLLDAVQTDEIDVAIAAISMTAEREERLDFSYPIYNSGLQVMARVVGPTWLAVVTASLVELAWIVLGIVGLMAIVAHGVWLVERRRNPDFHRAYWPGIWDAFWFTAVTLTTVGYGDKTARTTIGRALTLIWMLIGLFIVANFTAAITTRLTVNQLRGVIGGVDDLRGHRVVTVTGSTAADYLEQAGITYASVDNIHEAFIAVERGEADAIVYDAPVLRYYVAQGSPLSLVGEIFQHEPYGIALPPGSPLREELNRHLLEIISDGTYDRIHKRYFDT